jgi:hypothetical protein
VIRLTEPEPVAPTISLAGRFPRGSPLEGLEDPVAGLVDQVQERLPDPAQVPLPGQLAAKLRAALPPGVRHFTLPHDFFSDQVL